MVVTWLLLQDVNNVAPALNLPNWAVAFVLVLLLIGFPVALIFAWTFELKAAPTGANAGRATGGGTITYLWSPAHAPVRKTERFKSHIRAVGLLDYWRERGWPDGGHPAGASDFACD